MEINIGKKRIGDDHPVLLIAEAGINHNGDINIAHQLIDAAADAGADVVKFQTFITEDIIHHECPRPSHEELNIQENISHFDLVKKWELPFYEFEKLKVHSEDKGLIFMSTPYDLNSAEFLIKLNCEAIKMASAEMSNFYMLEFLGKSNIPIILSTGMNYWDEIVESVDFIKKFTDKLCILKCTSNYPASPESINLNGLKKIKEKFPNTLIGFSDHSEGKEIGIASLGLGVNVIERHFTLDKNTWGPDHRASMDPDEFKIFTKAVRKVEKAMGKKDWTVQDEEKSQRSTMQKGTYAKHDIKKGEDVSLKDVLFLRPKNGIKPKEFYLKYDGCKINKNISRGEFLTPENFVS